MTISEERIERAARAYAKAWRQDILEHQRMVVSAWDEMNEPQRDAMRRCARAALEADAPALLAAKIGGLREAHALLRNCSSIALALSDIDARIAELQAETEKRAAPTAATRIKAYD